MLFKVRLLVLSLLSVMVFGAVASGSALAEPGPFWHHRAEGGSGNGLKIEKQAPQAFEGEGSGTELTAKLGGVEFKIKCNIKAKGKIWNESSQAQGEVAVTYEKCVANSIEGCTVIVTPSGNYIIHLLWKYAGNAKELENKNQTLQGQHWDGLLLPLGVEVIPNAENKEAILKEKKSFAEVKFGGACGVLKALAGKAEGSTGFTS